MTNKIKQKLENLVSNAKGEVNTLKSAVSSNLMPIATGLVVAAGYALLTGEMAYFNETVPKADHNFLYALSALSTMGVVNGAYLTAMSAQWAIDDYKLAKSKKNTA